MPKEKNTESKSLKENQITRVTNLFKAHGIDLKLVPHGVAGLDAFRRAKNRTLYNKRYIAKGIKFKIGGNENNEGLALMDTIHNHTDKWHDIIRLNTIAMKSGKGSDNISIHRKDSSLHYSQDNIEIISKGDHIKEHSNKTHLLNLSKMELKVYDSQTALAKELEVGENVVSRSKGKTYGTKQDGKVEVLAWTNPTKADSDSVHETLEERLERQAKHRQAVAEREARLKE